MAFTLKAPIWKFYTVWVSLWWDIHINIDEKPNTQSTAWCLRWWHGDITSPFFFPDGLKHESQDQEPAGGSSTLDQEGGCWKTQCLAIEMCHDTQARKPNISCEKIFVTMWPLTSSQLTTLIIMCEAWLNEKPTKPLTQNMNQKQGQQQHLPI